MRCSSHNFSFLVLVKQGLGVFAPFLRNGGVLCKRLGARSG